MVGNSQSVSTTFDRRAKRRPLASALTPAEREVVTATSSSSAFTSPAKAARADSWRSTQYSHGAPYSSQSARYCSYEARTASERAPCEHELMYTRCSKIGNRCRHRAGSSVVATALTFRLYEQTVDLSSHFRDTKGQTLRFRTRPRLWTHRHTLVASRVRTCDCAKPARIPRGAHPKGWGQTPAGSDPTKACA